MEWPVSGDRNLEDNIRHYVLLPFSLGVLLYHEFDLDSDTINVDNFKRFSISIKSSRFLSF